MNLAGLGGAEVAVLLDQPLGIVTLDELPDGIPRLVDVAVDSAMDDLLLEDAVAPLGAPGGLALLDEGVGRQGGVAAAM